MRDSVQGLSFESSTQRKHTLCNWGGHSSAVLVCLWKSPRCKTRQVFISERVEDRPKTEDIDLTGQFGGLNLCCGQSKIRAHFYLDFILNKCRSVWRSWCEWRNAPNECMNGMKFRQIKRVGAAWYKRVKYFWTLKQTVVNAKIIRAAAVVSFFLCLGLWLDTFSVGKRWSWLIAKPTLCFYCFISNWTDRHLKQGKLVERNEQLSVFLPATMKQVQFALCSTVP